MQTCFQSPHTRVVIATQPDVIDADSVGGVQREDTTVEQATSNIEASWVPARTNKSIVVPYLQSMLQYFVETKYLVSLLTDERLLHDEW